MNERLKATHTNSVEATEGKKAGTAIAITLIMNKHNAMKNVQNSDCEQLLAVDVISETGSTATPKVSNVTPGLARQIACQKRWKVRVRRLLGVDRRDPP